MNPEQVKEAKKKVVSFIQLKGPSLPVQIAKEINLNFILAGAILSEMLSDKILRLSNLRVGGAYLYMMQGQEIMLEKFYTYLNRVEKEAYILLREKGILDDEQQSPPIRVALRSIKDFAIPFRFNKKLFWRYLTFSEEEVRDRLEKSEPSPPIMEVKHHKAEEIPITKQEVAPHEKIILTNNIKDEKLLDIFPEKEKELLKKEKKPKVDFMEEIKSSLQAKKIEILKIEKSGKIEALIKAKKEGKECLIFAFNKKKISDKELIRTYKKSLSYSLPYIILTKGDISKKMREILDAGKVLLGIEKL